MRTITVTKKVEIPVSTLRISIPLDCLYHDDDARDGVPPPDWPGVNGKNWEADIDLHTGKIAGWSMPSPVEIFGKVRDEGEYQLLDADGRIVVARVDGYVPGMINDGGDYISITVEPDGTIWDFAADIDDDWWAS